MPKTALMLLAPTNFRDEEYYETREALEASGLFTGVSDSTWELAKSRRAYAEEILKSVKTVA